MSHIKILLAEDDKNLGMILKAYLDAKGHRATLCSNGEEALEAFRKEPYDLCVTDITMPVMDGFALARQIKVLQPFMPIMFLSARKEQEDILEGFRIGADDYVTKPFSMDELLMRIEAIYRRTAMMQTQPTSYKLGSFTFDPLRHTLVRGKETIKLTSKESDLLLLLCENMNRTLERSKALQAIWEEESYQNARSMDVYITKLRKQFKDDLDVEIINVHGVGFKLVVK